MSRDNVKVALLAGLGIGAAVMYFLDPDRGNRRRHLVYDQSKSALNRGRRVLRDKAENMKNQARGKVAEARQRGRVEIVNDGVLVDRVRAELGHHVEHARAIEVVAEHGTVILRGAVPADEIARAAETACHVRGVDCVQNELVARA